MDLSSVRKLALEENFTEIYHNATSRVVSFIKYDGPDDDILIRMNVYWTTGTVGTCINHPHEGKTQLFRRLVDLETLRILYRDPRDQAGAGYYQYRFDSPRKTSRTKPDKASFPPNSRAHVSAFADCQVRSRPKTSESFKSLVKLKYDDGKTYHVKPNQTVPVTGASDQYEPSLDKESEAKKLLEVLQLEEEAILAEKREVQELLKDFEEEQKKNTEKEEHRQKSMDDLRGKAAKFDEIKRKREAEARRVETLEKERDERGRKIICALYYDADFVAKNFKNTVTCIACGGMATLMIYEHGGAAWTSTIPTQLDDKLNGRQRSLSPPEYVAMGSFDRYYVRFKDGSSDWVGCEDMTKKLNSRSSSSIMSVAFGASWDSFCIVFEDGGFCYQGLPHELHQLITSRGSKTDLACVSLGPNGEYFIRANDGKGWWGGMSRGNLRDIKRKQGSGVVKFIDFGDCGTYICRYT